MSFNEDTIVALYNKSGEPGRARRIEIKRGEPLIPMGKPVDCLYALRVGTVRLVPSSNVGKPPIVRLFHGNPHKDMPIVGGRYFFTRQRSTIAYVAETDCAVYTIGSDVLVDIHNDDGLLTMMRELVTNSDIAEDFAPIVARSLKIPIGSTFDEATLVAVCEEIRSAAFKPSVDRILKSMFTKFIGKRILAAEAAGIEASVCTEPPEMLSDR